MTDKKKYSTLELTERWEARRAIQNLMAKYAFSILLKREKVLYEDFWTMTQAPCYGCNEGYYVGAEAVKGYYDALHRKNILRTNLLKKDFPKEYEKLSDEEAYGAGVLNYKPLTNQIIEIAGDGKTAKGFWHVMGMYDEMSSAGPLSYWTCGMFAVDFIKEDENWKIWHLEYLEDIDHPCGENWTEQAKERARNDAYAAMDDFKLPEPTVKKTVRELYYKDRPFSETPPLPEPYESFDSAFSYGI